jgi:PhoPQ-activated pathogenicity-related protein
MNHKALCLTGFLFSLILSSPVLATPLDDYVATQDPVFDWVQYGSSVYNGNFLANTTAYNFILTSQTWRSSAEVSPTVWTHWMTVIVPGGLISVKDTALVLINGGNIGDPAPSIDPADSTNSQFRQLALATGSVIVALRGVPNQPLHFADEAFTRTEDQIIAYSWAKFLAGGDNHWPVQLPMVKSVVACMDAVQEFRPAVKHFVLTGGSKRGWTAWLTAAVDNRVTAIAPIVSDLLNMPRSFAHQWSCYGFWGQALLPYEQMGIFDWFEDPRTNDLMAMVDPYEYRARLTIPKLIVTAAGDDFFVHDSVQFYLDGLLGETYVRTFPNTNHYLDGVYDQVIANMVPFYNAFLKGSARPQFSWTRNADGSMTVTTSSTPMAVYLWQANNPAARDFRQVTIGTAWTQTTLSPQSPGVYVAAPGVPANGWRSYFVELVYDYQDTLLGSYDYHFTTEMRVLPEIRPFETDLTRDRLTDIADIGVLAENWLTASPYYDIMPRRTGDGILNLEELGVFSLHWLSD